MTSISRPHNATPQRLHLKPPNYPRMPFSSPMGEEILSPSSDPSHTPPQKQTKCALTHPMEEQRGNTQHMQDYPSESIGQRRFSIQKPMKGDWGTNRNDSPVRSKWPGLNVITDFSKGVDAVTSFPKPKLSTQKSVNGGAKQVAGKGQRHNRNEITQGYPTPSPDPRNGHERSGKPLKTSGSKGRLDTLKRASSKFSNLSPSDRAVMIGISISPERINQRGVSPEIDRSLGSSHSDRERRPSLTPSIAPSIMVTPAKENAPWSALEKNEPLPPRPKPASSVYSQAPVLRNRIIDSSIVPPIPPLPPEAQHKRSLPEVQHDDDKGQAARTPPTNTVFDNDPRLEAAIRSRPVSQESQLQLLKKSTSLDTIATRHRSQGWWNVLVSPFLPKSPMGLKIQHLSPERDVPPVPSTPTKASLPDQDQSKEDPKRSNCSQDRKSGDTGSAHTSFTDSSLEAECEKLALDFGGPTVVEDSVGEDTKTESPRESQSMPMRFEGLGAASEYYEACLYDMHSPTPYFDCQNHVCRPSTLGIGNDVNGFDDVQAPPTIRGLALVDTADSPNEQKGDAKSQAASQVPTNRFSAAFHEALRPRDKNRPESNATIIEDLDTTPDVQEARAAPVVKASEPVLAAQPILSKESRKAESARLPEESEYFSGAEPSPKPLPAVPPRASEKDVLNFKPEPEPEKPVKRFVAVLPPNPRHKTYKEPLSPAPPTPGGQKHAPRDGILLAEAVKVDASRASSLASESRNSYIANHNYHTPDSRNSSERMTATGLWPPPRPPQDPKWYEESWKTKEDRELPQREPKKSWNLPSMTACFHRKQKQTDQKEGKKRKWLWILIAVVLLLLIILIMVLAMTLTRKGDKMPVQSDWLNITGYPPIPTGISTIAQPDAVHEETGCVQPMTMWSCALPKEEQEDNMANASNQPNFRVEIRFQNGTNISTVNSSNIKPRSLAFPNPVSAGNFIRSKVLYLRSTFTSALYTPSPVPPSQEDQSFLGNTTDGVNDPSDGEFTPFFMSFQSPAPLSSHLSKRQDSSNGAIENDNPTDPFPDLTKSIPDPSTNPDGTAAPALLHPYPSAQPLRLYDRGLPSEHYGFYTYFDRSIFLKSTAPLSDSSITGNEEGAVPDDENGGADQKVASVRCTWAQTRFLVQIWTNKGSPQPLLQGNSTNDTDNNPVSKDQNSKTLTHSSANDFSRPGSFPYPISVTLDRHGGDIGKKMIYCYGIDPYRKPIKDSEK
ncbi:MAG: hypothetical protein Q9164_003923, partial [Protoblastenia rupestris]